jgi:hypothetical protein
MEKILLINLLIILSLILSCGEENMSTQKEIPQILDNWSILTGEYNSKPIVVRKNTGLKNIAGKGYFDLRSGIAFNVLKPEDNGLPSPKENEELNKLEDSLFQFTAVRLNSKKYKKGLYFQSLQC